MRVDAEDTVWMAGYLSNSLSRFDRSKKMFVEYPIPTPRAEVELPRFGGHLRIWEKGVHNGKESILVPA